MTQTIDEPLVRHIGKLSRIELTDEQVSTFGRQLSAILDYVDKLRHLDTREVEPLAHALPIRNVLRKDEPCESLPPEKAVGGAPDAAGDFFRVPRVIDEGAGA